MLNFGKHPAIMKNQMNKYRILISPLFISGLILLLINDHVLKYSNPNFITGKLSDFIGLFLFGLFVITLIQKKQKLILILTGILFIYWKSELSEGLIKNLNILIPININRTVDYTDLVSIIILPLSYIAYEKFKYHNTKLNLLYILPSIMIFSATTVVHPMIVDSEKLVRANIDSIDYKISIPRTKYELFMKEPTNPSVSYSGVGNFEKVVKNYDTITINYKTLIPFPVDSAQTEYLYANARFKEIKDDKKYILLELIDAEAFVRPNEVEKDVRNLMMGIKREIKYTIKANRKKN